jgi:cyclic pyranopterin monophosphate synthase
MPTSLGSTDNKDFTHLDTQGQARMVDVSDKKETLRQATAKSRIFLGDKVFDRLIHGRLKKGDAFAAARLAGIMAVKNTPQLIPLCHMIPITGVEIDFFPDVPKLSLEIRVMVKARAQTGVEMEALAGAAAAALTIYDMCKALDRGMIIENIHLVQKSGGKSGDYYQSTREQGDNH